MTSWRERTNAQRSDTAAGMLRLLHSRYGGDDARNVADLLADLMHYGIAPEKLDECLVKAKMHFEHEK